MSANMSNNNQNNHVRYRFAIEERRRQVAKLYALCETETEIASELGISQKMVSRGIIALREMSRQFVFDLAKSDLACYYRQSIDGIEFALNKAYKLVKAGLVPQYELMALRLIKDCSEAKFELFEKGPAVLNIKSLQEQILKMENDHDNRLKQELI